MMVSLTSFMVVRIGGRKLVHDLMTDTLVMTDDKVVMLFFYTMKRLTGG